MLQAYRQDPQDLLLPQSPQFLQHEELSQFFPHLAESIIVPTPPNNNATIHKVMIFFIRTPLTFKATLHTMRRHTYNTKKK